MELRHPLTKEAMAVLAGICVGVTDYGGGGVIGVRLSQKPRNGILLTELSL